MLTSENLNNESELPAIITDHQGIIYINTVFEDTFGWSYLEIVGQALTVLLPSYFRDAHNLGFSRFSATGISTILNYPLQLKVVIERLNLSI